MLSNASPDSGTDHVDDESPMQPLRPHGYLLGLAIVLLVVWGSFLIWIVATS